MAERPSVTNRDPYERPWVCHTIVDNFTFNNLNERNPNPFQKVVTHIPNTFGVIGEQAVYRTMDVDRFLLGSVGIPQARPKDEQGRRIPLSEDFTSGGLLTRWGSRLAYVSLVGLVAHVLRGVIKKSPVLPSLPKMLNFVKAQLPMGLAFFAVAEGLSTRSDLGVDIVEWGANLFNGGEERFVITGEARDKGRLLSAAGLVALSLWYIDRSYGQWHRVTPEMTDRLKVLKGELLQVKEGRARDVWSAISNGRLAQAWKAWRAPASQVATIVKKMNPLMRHSRLGAFVWCGFYSVFYFYSQFGTAQRGLSVVLPQDYNGKTTLNPLNWMWDQDHMNVDIYTAYFTGWALTSPMWHAVSALLAQYVQGPSHQYLVGAWQAVVGTSLNRIQATAEALGVSGKRLEAVRSHAVRGGRGYWRDLWSRFRAGMELGGIDNARKAAKEGITTLGKGRLARLIARFFPASYFLVAVPFGIASSSIAGRLLAIARGYKGDSPDDKRTANNDAARAAITRPFNEFAVATHLNPPYTVFRYFSYGMTGVVEPFNACTYIPTAPLKNIEFVLHRLDNAGNDEAYREARSAHIRRMWTGLPEISRPSVRSVLQHRLEFADLFDA